MGKEKPEFYSSHLHTSIPPYLHTSTRNVNPDPDSNLSTMLILMAACSMQHVACSMCYRHRTTMYTVRIRSYRTYIHVHMCVRSSIFDHRYSVFGVWWWMFGGGVWWGMLGDVRQWCLVVISMFRSLLHVWSGVTCLYMYAYMQT